MDSEKIKTASQLIYEYEIEVSYWDNYIINLVDFMYFDKLTKNQVMSIHNEIYRVNEYKKLLANKIEQYLKSN